MKRVISPYVFENDRILSRMATFAGRNNIQFRTFLSYYVLKHLFLEWRRTQKEVERSASTPLGDASEGGGLKDVLPDQFTGSRRTLEPVLKATQFTLTQKND